MPEFGLLTWPLALTIAFIESIALHSYNTAIHDTNTHTQSAYNKQHYVCILYWTRKWQFDLFLILVNLPAPENPPKLHKNTQIWNESAPDGLWDNMRSFLSCKLTCKSGKSKFFQYWNIDDTFAAAMLIDHWTKKSNSHTHTLELFCAQTRFDVAAYSAYPIACSEHSACSVCSTWRVPLFHQRGSK